MKEGEFWAKDSVPAKSGRHKMAQCTKEVSAVDILKCRQESGRNSQQMRLDRCVKVRS